MPFLILAGIVFVSIAVLQATSDNNKTSAVTQEGRKKYSEENQSNSQSQSDYGYALDQADRDAYCQMGIADSVGINCEYSHDD